MLINFILVIASIFFAINMGVSGFAVAFTPSYGSKLLKKSKAVLFYALFVFIGGILIGPRVVETLTKNISAHQLNPTSGLLVIISAGAMMFLSNMLKIPQSTSFITVASFIGAGLHYGQVKWGTVNKILIVAAVFSFLSFVVTFLLKRSIYPPHPRNLRFYEKFHIHRNKFKQFIIWTDLYSAFGVGTNNVANVVAPVLCALSINPLLALGLAAPFFGLGAFLMGERVIKTVSQRIVPIGEISAVIVSLITSTFVIIASLLGLPTPYVQFTTFSVLAISCVKDGTRHTVGKSIFHRIISAWILVPLATVVVSLILHSIFIKK